MKGKTLRRLFAWLLSVTLLATCVPAGFAEESLSAGEETQGEPMEEEATTEEDEAPQEEEAAPQEEVENPQENDETPQGNDETPQENDETPQENDEAPQGNDATPQGNDETPQGNDATPQENDATPQENDETPQGNDATPQGNGGTPSGGTACAHKASSVLQTEWVPVGEHTVTPDAHAVAKAAVKVTVCELCGEVLSRERTSGEVPPMPEAHTFVDGVCTACGYAQPAEADEDGGDDESDGTVEPNRTGESNESDKDDDSTEETPCQHEAAAETRTEWAATGGYRIGSDTHAAVTAEYSVTVCELCGEVLTREPTGEEAVADAEPHDFGEGAVCIVCGAANLKEGDVKEPCPDGQHAFVDGVCTVCGAVANPSEGQSDEAPASGMLLMSLDGKCTHPNGVFGERQSTDVKPVSNGDGTHTVTYEWMLYSCPTCNGTNIVLEPEYRKEKQPCDYDSLGESDRCYQCGFKNPCRHELRKQYEELKNATITPNYDGTHTRTGDRYRWEVCVTCGKTINEEGELVAQNETIFEACDYGLGGHTCRVCKAELPEGVACAHMNRVYYWSFKDGTYVDNGDGTHTSTYTYVKNFYCEDCYHEGPDESGETTVQICIEPHRMRSDGKYAGTCIDCDYNAGSDYVDKRDTCGHPDRRETLITNFNYTGEGVIARDENGHTLEAWTEKYEYCLDCGWQQYDGFTGEKESRVEPHEYYEGDNYCHICGYIKKCGHSKKKTFYQPSGNKRVAEQIDENSHRITFDLVQYVTCLECGETVSETVVDENLTRIEPHVFDRFSGGICEVCGYVKACDHAHTAVRRSLENADDDYNNITFQQIDEKRHYARVSVAEWIVCTDCGQGLKVIYEPMQEVIVDHNFSALADGWRQCFDCGYLERSDCKHGKPQPVEEVSDDYAAVVPQADGHLVTYNRTFETVRCADCGIILSQTIKDESKTETLPHEFENGKCTVCGYKNTCKHDGAMTQDTYNTLVRNAEDNGDGTHKMLADIVTVKRCELCGEEWVVGLERNHVFTAEAHEYVDGECWVCHAPAPAPSTPPQSSGSSSSGSSGGSSSGSRRTGGATAVQPAEPLMPQTPAAATQELALSVNSIALQLTVSPSATIEIVGAEEIMTQAEYQRFDRLNLSEQIMVMLSVAGATQDITSTLPPSAMLLTADAQTLIAEIAGRIRTGGETPFQFEIGAVTVNGVPCKCVTITFEVTVDGVKMLTTRSFYFDPTLGEWVAVDALATV